MGEGGARREGGGRGARAGAWIPGVIVRALAGGLGLFALLNLTAALRGTGVDANLWWVDLRDLPAPLARALEGLAGLLLVAYAARPAASRPRAASATLVLGLLALLALRDALRFWGLLADGIVHAPLPLPFSAFVAPLLALVAWRHHAAPPRAPLVAAWVVGALTLALAAVGFPLAQMVFYGRTDYTRPADAVVVFGARTFADGRPSDALADRVRTAAGLVTAGHARRLFVSGGPGDGSVHETEAMRDLAADLGVPRDSIVLDRDGWSTALTVANADAWMAAEGLETALAVSHAYHLPRIQMAFQRANRTAYTVPAIESYPLTRLPWFMGREVAAFWVYWLRGLR